MALFFHACSGKARDNTINIQFKLTFSGQKDDADADPASVITLDLACKHVAKHLPRFKDLRLRVRRFQCLDEDAIWRTILLQLKGLRSILVRNWGILDQSLYKNGSELRLCGWKVCRSLCESMVHPAFSDPSLCVEAIHTENHWGSSTLVFTNRQDLLQFCPYDECLHLKDEEDDTYATLAQHLEQQQFL